MIDQETLGREIFRISTQFGTRITRNIVFLDDNQHYRINSESFDSTIPNQMTSRFDIHGPMGEQAYIAWLTNALFNRVYREATPEEKKWMLP